MNNKDIEKIILEILQAKFLEIRDIENGGEPFLYSSGNYGPGYVSLRDSVGSKKMIKFLAEFLAKKVKKIAPNIDLIAGNATAGIVPGWLVSEYMDLPFIYVRDTKKEYGQKDQLVGVRGNVEISSGDNALIVDELVNHGSNIIKSAKALREAGLTVTHAACFMSYARLEVARNLKKENIKLIYLFTLPQFLDVAGKHKIYSQKVINAFKEYLKNPEN